MARNNNLLLCNSKQQVITTRAWVLRDTDPDSHGALVDTKKKDARFQFEDEAPAEEEEEEEEEKQQEKEEEGGETPAEEAEEDDFETAWDVLDVARVIFEKGEDKESKLKLADVHLCLADLSAETGNECISASR